MRNAQVSDEVFALCMNLDLQNLGLLVTVNLKVNTPITFTGVSSPPQNAGDLRV